MARWQEEDRTGWLLQLRLLTASKAEMRLEGSRINNEVVQDGTVCKSTSMKW